MDKIKRIILFHIPMSICNFRCQYCYLSQRKECYQGVQPEKKYTPEQMAKAFSPERMGGKVFMNFCADGETLLTKDIDLYIKALVEQGHYAEIVTNMTITPVIDKILSWDKELLKRVEFKCSFHYLELKKRNLLDTFAINVNRAWEAGASANIEITPSDELIPHIDDVKAFSMTHFGALPHLTIARDDRTKGIDYLTNLSMEEYDSIWSSFDSDFWKYKKTVFGIRQKSFCYAGLWSLNVNFITGVAKQCYCGKVLGDIVENPEKPVDFDPIAICSLAHCYNAHALLTLGLIPDATDVRYGNIRNRVKADGTQWLQPELLEFFNSQCKESNEQLSRGTQFVIKIRSFTRWKVKRAINKIKRFKNK